MPGIYICRLAIFLMMAAAGFGCSTTEPAMPKQFIDLSPTIGKDLVARQYGPLIAGVGYLPEPRFEHLVEKGSDYYSAMSVVTLLNHLGSHIDPPRHIFEKGRSVDQMPLERFYGNVVFYDFRDRPRNHPLLPDDFRLKEIRPGSVVIAYVGYQAPTVPDELPSYPYLSGEAAHYLAARGIKAFGTDMPALMSIIDRATAPTEAMGIENAFPEHTALLEQDIAVVEGLTNLQALVDVPNVVFVGFPIKLEEGTGAPIRAVGLVY